ncbi:MULTISPECIES: putative quinol monooxygenase [unclassified Agarivorans]|uniref:putative quinol monooxygenase n=1 Tax=unclassified Agarivorans TaxID=2636026 RepID=UPI0026E156AD|nr:MULTISPECIES: antibiotic biosynthesis monooxygenase [unclassified Agarivorans]MDO6686144.1 antibiotic biosynthesis monooxygenase [Agarivorans sp. 3_MG-2023]MDO6716407.1 antibiotic biosynthesis monooxygenase [Agarivorans sp. 2_MG-2023]
MSTVILQGFIIVSDANLETVKCALIHHKQLTLAEEGCLVFRVEPDEINPKQFNVYEVFINQAAFDCHQARVKASYWGEVTKDLERHYQITTA